MPQPRARPNGAERRAKYYRRLAADLDTYAQTGEVRNPRCGTKLWEECLPQAGQKEYRSRRHAREADRLHQARGGAPQIAARTLGICARVPVPTAAAKVGASHARSSRTSGTAGVEGGCFCWQ